MDSNGKFAERRQLGAFIVKYGYKVIAISDYEQIKEVNLTKTGINSQRLIIRGSSDR